MTKKNISLIAFALVLAGFSLYLNRDRFRSETIQIGERWVEPRGAMLRRAQKPSGPVLMFLLDRETQLTSVKVVPLAELRTNKFAHPVWELTTESNSVPIKDFVYGRNIRGMRPPVKGAIADTLATNTQYRLFITTAKLKAEHDFTGPANTR